jgi:hypothetical protein
LSAAMLVAATLLAALAARAGWRQLSLGNATQAML